MLIFLLVLPYLTQILIVTMIMNIIILILISLWRSLPVHIPIKFNIIIIMNMNENVF